MITCWSSRSSGATASRSRPTGRATGFALSDRARRELAVPDVLDPRELPAAPPGPIDLPARDATCEQEGG